MHISTSKYKKLRIAVSVLLSFLIAAALFFGVFAAELCVGWLNCDKLHQKISEESYPYRMLEQMKSDLEDLLEQHALGSEVLENIWDEQTLYRIFYTYSEDVLLKGETEIQDTYDFETRLRESIEQSLAEENATNLETISAEIDQTTADAAAIYQNYMYPGFLKRFYRLSESAAPVLKILMVAAALVIAISVVILWRLYHYKHHAIEYMAGGFLAGSIWNLPAVLLMGNGGWVASSGIGPAFYRNLLSAFLTDGLQIGIMVTGIEILVFLVLWTRIRASKKKR